MGDGVGKGLISKSKGIIIENGLSETQNKAREEFTCILNSCAIII